MYLKEDVDDDDSVCRSGWGGEGRGVGWATVPLSFLLLQILLREAELFVIYIKENEC